MEAADEYLRRTDFEYGIRWIERGTMHREKMTKAEALAFVDPAVWEGAPRPVREVFEVVQRRHGLWQVVS